MHAAKLQTVGTPCDTALFNATLRDDRTLPAQHASF